MRDGTIEDKRSTLSEVIQCFNFGEKRRMDSARFRRGKEHTRWLLVPTRRGD
jgi:hypothetical protein